MDIRFYGRLADHFGERLRVDGDPCSVGELRERLALSHPGGADALRDRRTRACVAGVLCGEQDILVDGQEVEFLAPVSGG